MNDELKPCPFCGSRDNRPRKHKEDCYLRLWADCQERYYRYGDSVVLGSPEDEKIKKAWNTRVEST